MSLVTVLLPILIAKMADKDKEKTPVIVNVIVNNGNVDTIEVQEPEPEPTKVDKLKEELRSKILKK